MNSPTATTSRLSPLLRQAYRPKPAPAKQISRQSQREHQTACPVTGCQSLVPDLRHPGILLRWCS